MTEEVSAEPGVVPGSVVVGVDGSEPSLRALRWGARQAALTGSSLEVVTAWTFPEHPAPLGVVPKVPYPDETLAEARDALDRLLDEVLPDRDQDRVHAHVIHGAAVPVLVEAARSADLLVIGTRGRGEFTELVLGSVSDGCVRHAGCPVVVVR